MDSDTTALLDHDDERLLAVDTTTGAGTLTVLDRRTGEAHPAGQVDYQRRAALVPGGVIASADGSLVLTGSDGVEVWAKYQGIGTEPVHTLVGVDTEAGVVAVAVAPPAERYTLTGFALADGAPLWTVPRVGRVGTIRVGAEPARPPGALRDLGLVPVIRSEDVARKPSAIVATWSLVSVASGEVVGTTVEDTATGQPTVPGSVAVPSRVERCADFELLGTDAEVRWPGEPPAGECLPVWAFDSERVLLTAREGDKGFAGTRCGCSAWRWTRARSPSWTGPGPTRTRTRRGPARSCSSRGADTCSSTASSTTPRPVGGCGRPSGPGSPTARRWSPRSCQASTVRRGRVGGVALAAPRRPGDRRADG